VGAKSSMTPTCAEDECYALQTKTCEPIADPYVCKMGDPSGMCGKYVGVAEYLDEPLGHCYWKKSDAYTCNEDRKSCAKAGGGSNNCEYYYGKVTNTICPNTVLPQFGETDFCTIGLKQKTAVNQGEWCYNQKENICENMYVPYDVPGYGGKGYYECVLEKNKCKPKRSVGEDGISKDVFNFCADVCLAVSATKLTHNGESCSAQPDATTAAELKMWRVLNQTECESFSRDVTLTGVADAQTTIYPCIWQGAVNGVNNSNCHPDYNPPTAACHCVSGSEPCIDQAPWLCSGTPTICEQMALPDGL